MKGKMIGNDIFLFRKIIPKNDCELITETIENYPAWEEAKIFGFKENHRKTKVDYLSVRYGFNSDLYRAHAIIGYNFKKSFEFLKNEYLNSDNESYLYYKGDEGVQILKYETGEFYREHIDMGQDVNRTHSCIMYLNDEYEGGETEFIRQKIKFKGKVGDIIFFPSSFTHPHIAHQITSGTKYTAVIWSF